MSLRVMASWPSRIATCAEARTRCERLPIMPRVRMCCTERFAAARQACGGAAATCSPGWRPRPATRRRGERGGAEDDAAAQDLGAADPGQPADHVDPGEDEFSELKTIIDIYCSGRFPGSRGGWL
jgi:hypothetical protein